MPDDASAAKRVFCACLDAWPAAHEHLNRNWAWFWD
jgi:hypothetical protein